ncbi:MAG: hypothetical protein EA368_08510 [Leptolyngbya sp. DLM2.Bin27]|nr:MAG: hypothetical protein EA368_08510 [Leptolyngbya sp. DLM2.Bin27]
MKGPSIQPWDMAGADGLVAARALFGEAVDHLAPFQSLETELAGEACSVLRLGDRNFRLTYPGPIDQAIAPLSLRLWVTQLPWMAAITLPIASLPDLADRATARAPHRLSSLPLHRAVPAQVAQISVLVWHHSPGGQPTLELHLASAQIKNFWAVIQPFNGGSVSLTTAHP